MIAHGLSTQLLDRNEYPDTISNLFNSHLLEYKLIAFDKIAAGDIVDWNEYQKPYFNLDGYGVGCEMAQKFLRNTA